MLESLCSQRAAYGFSALSDKATRKTFYGAGNALTLFSPGRAPHCFDSSIRFFWENCIRIFVIQRSVEGRAATILILAYMLPTRVVGISGVPVRCTQTDSRIIGDRASGNDFLLFVQG